MSPSGTELPSADGTMLRVAPMAAFVCCACEIVGMIERRVWAVNDAPVVSQNVQWCAALVGGFEPKLTAFRGATNGCFGGQRRRTSFRENHRGYSSILTWINEERGKTCKFAVVGGIILI